MGNIFAYKGTYPETLPYPDDKPTFDPQFGFPAPRKERVKPLTLEEMRALQIPTGSRNYCVDNYVKYKKCMKRTMPFHILCQPELHELRHCYEQDSILRRKEFERERRLRERQAKLDGKLPM
ncbi:hypothetical protein RUM43_006749 [Polyplax serrata]|uniref:NADH dehydrogenase [ubiquinone] 1 beta subcomplex subunit 7 n=1 Tax=Polyplax serrata TaxID=468196 RepID=A0AAN8PW62_POLSC